MQGEVLAYKEEKSIPKELHECWCQESVVASRYDASKGLKNPCSGDVSPRRGNTKRRQMVVVAGKKGTTSLCLFMEAYGLEGKEEEELSTMPNSVLGRRSLGWKMAARTKRSVDEANSRSSDVETGERTCRSGDV